MPNKLRTKRIVKLNIKLLKTKYQIVNIQYQMTRKYQTSKRQMACYITYTRFLSMCMSASEATDNYHT